MKCRNCGEKLAKDAVTCPNCGAAQNVKKKKSAGRIILGVIIFILGVCLIFGALSDSSTPAKVDGAKSSKSTAADIFAEVYTVGDTLEMKNVRVTLNSVTESTGANYVNPTDGKIFVICEYTIENNTSSDLAVSSLMSFECYADDFTCPVSIGAMLASGNAQLDGTVAAGKKINGVVGYEVDPDYTKLELHYNPKLAGTDFVFVYEK